MERCDFLVIGAGIAGTSAAYALAAHGYAVLLEREEQAGYHTTGRSAAMFSEAYGGPVLRSLTRASRGFMERPPEGFAAAPLLAPRGMMYVGRADQAAALERFYEENRHDAPGVLRLGGGEARARAPLLREGYAAGAVLESEAREIDVAALHQGFLRGLRDRGGRFVAGAGVRALARDRALWQAETAAGAFAAPVVVNAAGAWGDEVAALAGVAPLGLEPKRRTVFVFDAPDGIPGDSPMVIDVGEAFYFKPDSGRLLGSPADEDPSPPCDAQPEELDIALGADRIGKAAEVEIRVIRNKWAGLRSFVRDREPVAGYDASAEGFFWLVGQGGGGIMTAPAMAEAAAALVTGRPLPAPLAACGVRAACLDPARLR